jgi:Protein of unknown function (DUF1344)
MRVLIGAVVATAILGAATAAFAAEATGTVKSINMKKDNVTMTNGATYAAGKGLDLSTLKVGEMVAVTYSMKGTAMEATAIKPAG